MLTLHFHNHLSNVILYSKTFGYQILIFYQRNLKKGVACAYLCALLNMLPKNSICKYSIGNISQHFNRKFWPTKFTALIISDCSDNSFNLKCNILPAVFNKDSNENYAFYEGACIKELPHEGQLKFNK